MNYIETFILVAEDCPAQHGVEPTIKAGKPKPIHAIQYDLMAHSPYQHTQEDILYTVYAERQAAASKEVASRAEYFKKGRACLRASSLTKRYGWGVHFDEKGRAALYSRDSAEYFAFAEGHNPAVKLLKAMRNKRKGK